jgi:hypothetical protein
VTHAQAPDRESQEEREEEEEEEQEEEEEEEGEQKSLQEEGGEEGQPLLVAMHDANQVMEELDANEGYWMRGCVCVGGGGAEKGASLSLSLFVPDSVGVSLEEQATAAQRGRCCCRDRAQKGARNNYPPVHSW